METPVIPYEPPTIAGEKKKRQKKPKPIPIPIFEVGWCDTVFKDEKSKLPLQIILPGIVNYDRLKMLAAMNKKQTFLQVNAYEPHPEFTDICEWDSNHELSPDSCSVFGTAIDGDDDLSGESDFDELPVDGLRSMRELNFKPNDDAETMRNITWLYDKQLDPPSDLFKHDDEMFAHEELRLKHETAHLFDNSLTSFLAMMPLDFWRNVLIQTNATATQVVQTNCREQLAGRKWSSPFTIDELMKFLGLLVILGLGKCGSYEKYWNGNSSMRVFMPRKYYLILFIYIYLGELGETFADIMPLHRFQQLRSALTFHVQEVPEDPLYRLRPLINTLRRTFLHYVVPGREISLDEACIACRSQYARHLIMYNAKKPSGKYHFRLYVSCCAKCWYVYAFKIHSKASREHENDGEEEESSSSEDESLPDADPKPRKKAPIDVSVLRQHVLDITKPFEGIYSYLYY